MNEAAIVWRRGDELSAAELYELLCLRVDVFIVEQACAYAETDRRDLLDTTWHGWVASTEGSMAAAVRLLLAPDLPQIGRVVTRAIDRGNGLAAALVLAAHARCDGTSFLEAQSYLVDWYRQLGWTVVGDEFVEDGIAHRPMQRIDH